MADITKCTGFECPFKEHCRRFTVEDSYWQSYFCESPLIDGMCDEYWGDVEEYIRIKLNEAEE